MASENEIRLAGVVKESIVDGPGIRYTVFVQGCPHGCPGCHNPETHDFEGGYTESIEVLLEDFKSNPLLTGITLSGGEPMCQAKALLPLAKAVRELGKDVVIYTGYTAEALSEMSKEVPEIKELALTARLMVDGPYMQDLRDLTLVFRGSSNQRLLDNGMIQEIFGK